MTGDPIVIHELGHSFGEGALRRQVLFDVSLEVRAGEIVILTGPSGSGKTTLLTLIGALRSAQQGSLRVLGRELRGADESTLVSVRRQIGYVFQQHNLLESLSAQQNVRMAVQLEGELSARELEGRAAEALASVGLAERAHGHPSELSGGERQRVAIARALARRPRIVLADEPTAALDRETGRGVVDLLQRLARRDGVTVVLVTHDSRVLDVADRILAIEDGRLSSFLGWVGTDTRQRLRLLAAEARRGGLAERMRGLDERAFAALLDSLTQESRQLLDVVDVIQSETFESLLAELADGFRARLRDAFRAEQAALAFADADGSGFWAIARCPHGAPETSAVRPPDTHAAEAARATADSLSAPIADSRGRTFAVLEVANPAGRSSFTPAEGEKLAALAASVGTLLEGWWRMSCNCRSRGFGAAPACCAQHADTPAAPPTP